MNLIKGGDLILLKHIEIDGYLTADTPYESDSAECYIRKYEGEFKDE